MSRWVAFVVVCGCAVPATAPPLPVSAKATMTTAVADAMPQTWRPVTTPPFAAAAPLLLTDGTVMVQELETENWWQLTPDAMGSYEHGTWSKLASMPAGYSPLYTASAVLMDGKVIVQGGEYLAGDFAFTTQGALYDPLANTWTSVTPPTGWMTIGDASGIVLPDGRWMLSSCCDKPPEQAIWDENTKVWTPTGMGKLDIHDEESWALLYDGTILTVDANNTTDLTATEIYDPATGVWKPAGHTPIQISDLDPDNSGSHEIGPNVLRNDGTVLALGGNGHNAVYDPVTMTWGSAPDLPNIGGQLDVADGPAATLPNGNTLVSASPGIFMPPTHFFEWDGTTFTQVADPPNASANTTYQHNMIVLPTGEIMLTDFSTDIELYTPSPGHPDNAVPVVLAAPQPMTTAREGAPAEPAPPSLAEADGITPVDEPVPRPHLQAAGAAHERHHAGRLLRRRRADVHELPDHPPDVPGHQPRPVLSHARSSRRARSAPTRPAPRCSTCPRAPSAASRTSRSWPTASRRRQSSST